MLNAHNVLSRKNVKKTSKQVEKELMKFRKKQINLLPCPFCGELPAIVSLGQNERKFIRCDNQDCLVDCHTNPNLGNVYQQAEDWNKRA